MRREAARVPQKKSLDTQADLGLIHQGVEFSRRGIGSSIGKPEHQMENHERQARRIISG
jgi:hypothetical protein